jgi:nitrogenase molybdenum-iron protein NifN
MAHVSESKKACAVNPLKMSSPLGASYAFMGLQSCMPVMHGSQGCTSFGLVLLVRHFKEAIPLQTTAMNEVTTIMGGYDNIEKAILNIRQRTKPQIIAICSTGLTETKGDDVDGYIELVRQKHPEVADTEIVYVSTPDYVGGFQDGWAAAVTGLMKALPEPGQATVKGRVAVLPGWHFTPGDLEEVREIVESFGLECVIAPDVSGSLDGHIPEDWLATTLGGTPLAQLKALGSAELCLALGEQMRPAAQMLQDRCGVPFELFDRLTGLVVTDQFLMRLSQLSGRPVPLKWRRQRSQLVDAMLDGHFHFGNKRVALAAEPDLLWSMGNFLVEMGAELSVCITTTPSPLLAKMPTNEVVIGDLEDLEIAAKAVDADLLMTHSHGRMAAERLGKTLFRVGLPMFDRIGNSHKCYAGYRGTRNFVYEVGNVFMAQIHHHHEGDWPLPPLSLAAAQGQVLEAMPAVAHVPADSIPRAAKPAAAHS